MRYDAGGSPARNGGTSDDDESDSLDAEKGRATRQVAFLFFPLSPIPLALSSRHHPLFPLLSQNWPPAHCIGRRAVYRNCRVDMSRTFDYQQGTLYRRTRNFVKWLAPGFCGGFVGMYANVDRKTVKCICFTIHFHAYVYMRVHVGIHVSVYVNACMYVSVCVYAYLCTCARLKRCIQKKEVFLLLLSLGPGESQHI